MAEWRCSFCWRLPGDAIRYKQVVYGVTNANGLYVLRYEAPVLHYFDLGLPAFEATVASFALL